MTAGNDIGVSVGRTADHLKARDGMNCRLLGNGTTPGVKTGGSWRFGKADTGQWTDRDAVGPRREGRQGADGQ